MRFRRFLKSSPQLLVGVFFVIFTSVFAIGFLFLGAGSRLTFSNSIGSASGQYLPVTMTSAFEGEVTSYHSNFSDLGFRINVVGHEEDYTDQELRINPDFDQETRDFVRGGILNAELVPIGFRLELFSESGERIRESVITAKSVTSQVEVGFSFERLTDSRDRTYHYRLTRIEPITEEGDSYDGHIPNRAEVSISSNQQEGDYASSITYTFEREEVVTKWTEYLGLTAGKFVAIFLGFSFSMLLLVGATMLLCSVILEHWGYLFSKDSIDIALVSVFATSLFYLLLHLGIELVTHLRNSEYLIRDEVLYYILGLLAFSSLVLGIKNSDRASVVDRLGNTVISKLTWGWLLVVESILFIIVRIPYLDSGFINTVHADKYSTHLPQLQGMIESGSMLENVNPAYASIFGGGVTSFSHFGEFPFFAWLLYPFQFIDEVWENELVIHLLLSVLGIIFFYFLMKFLKISFGARESLIVGLFLVVNPSFHLLSFIPIMDLPALILTLLSWLAFHTDKRDLAYMLAGLAVMMKLSFAFIVVPYLLIHLFRKREDRFEEVLKLGGLSLLPYFLFEILIEPLPSLSSFPALINVLLFLLVLIIVTCQISRVMSRIPHISGRYRWEILILGGVIVYAALGQEIVSLSAKFLPDAETIFNVQLYAEVVVDIAELIHPILLPFAAIGVTGLLKNDGYNPQLRGLSIISLVYLFFAVKVIYFHIYYKHIFVILALVFAAKGVLKVKSLLKNKFALTVLSLILVFGITFSSLLSFPAYFAKRQEVNIEVVAEYLVDQMPEGGKIMRKDTTTKNITLYEDLAIFNYANFVGDKLDRTRKEIKDYGFAEFLHRQGVYYVINLGPLDFSTFFYWFEDDISSITRTDLILGNEGIKSANEDQLLEEIGSVIQLERIMGTVHIYRVKYE